MSQNVVETRHGGDGVWLPITEYSVKSGVSLSTIRRKIKSNSIQFKIDKGRYLILFKEATTPTLASKPHNTDLILEIEKPEISVSVKPVNSFELFEEPEEEVKFPHVDTAVKMVSTAFEHALKEKEERIRVLEKRNKDLEARAQELKMLVQMLEQKYRVRY